MSEFIKTGYPSDKQLLTYNIHTITALIPYLDDKEFWDAGRKQKFTFIHWDNQYLPGRTLDQPTVYGRLKAESLKSGSRLVVLPYPADSMQMPGLRLIKAVDQNITGDEKYYLYRFRD